MKRISLSHILSNRMCLLIALLLLGIFPLFAESAQPYRTAAKKQEIRTLRMRYVEQNAPKRPFLVLINGVVDGADPQNTLEISFDCLDHTLRQFSYTVYHLNKDNTRSDLQSTEYIIGFTTQDITSYDLSVNTQQPYTHYFFTFPNQDIQLTKSGNYVLHIYEDGDRTNTVADVCFRVVDPLVETHVQVRPETDTEMHGRFQQVNLELDMRHLSGFNPQEISVYVQQNNREDNAVWLGRPTYVEPTRLRYEQERDLIFEGGNEFRHFDLFSVYYAGYHVDHVRYERPYYHAFLEPDDNRGAGPHSTDRTGTPYVFEYDTNGQWVINTENSDYDDTDADYMWVHWMLPMEEPFFDGSVYVSGDLFNNAFTLTNRMDYDNEARCYYLNAYLKQGAYDYEYRFVAKGQQQATLQRTEGSHWQTQNRYSVAVYYRPLGGRYDRMVGYSVVE